MSYQTYFISNVNGVRSMREVAWAVDVGEVYLREFDEQGRVKRLIHTTPINRPVFFLLPPAISPSTGVSAFAFSTIFCLGLFSCPSFQNRLSR